MGLAETALRLVLPRGSAWALAGHGGALAHGVAQSLERARASAAGIEPEARPGTATLTLPEWHAALGQHYDPLLPVATQRARLDAFLYSSGGAALDRLLAQVARELPGITIAEVSTAGECGEDECGVSECGASAGDISSVYFDVIGNLVDDTEVERLAIVLSHFAPLHLTPFSMLTILSDSGESECGIGATGLEECGA